MSTDTTTGLPEDLASALAAHLADAINNRHLKEVAAGLCSKADPQSLKALLAQGYGYAEIPDLESAVVVFRHEDELTVCYGRIQAVVDGCEQNPYCHSKVELPNLDWVDLYYKFEKTLIYNHHRSTSFDEPQPPPRSIVIHLEGGLGARKFIKGWRGAHKA